MATPVMVPSNYYFVPVLVQLTVLHEIHGSSASSLVVGSVYRCIVVFIDRALRSGIVNVAVVTIVVESGKTGVVLMRRR